MARTKMVRRWRKNMDVSDDTQYAEMLATLSEGSVRRSFNPYTDIDWDAQAFAVKADDPRWILPESDPIGAHAWYQAQSMERQIEIGMWRQANVAKVGEQFENILIRGANQCAAPSARRHRMPLRQGSGSRTPGHPCEHRTGHWRDTPR